MALTTDGPSVKPILNPPLFLVLSMLTLSLNIEVIEKR